MPDRKEIAVLMSAALDRPIAVGEPSLADWMAAARPPHDPAQLAMLEKNFAHYAAYGQPGTTFAARLHRRTGLRRYRW
jgi:hypothetical protein